jgi:hypothetical protein
MKGLFIQLGEKYFLTRTSLIFPGYLLIPHIGNGIKIVSDYFKTL